MFVNSLELKKSSLPKPYQICYNFNRFKKLLISYEIHTDMVSCADVFLLHGGFEMLEILVVDDEQEITRALKDFFTAKSYKVRVANNGRQALELAKTYRPHLVFLDIRMPKMDGLTVLRNIREIDRSIKVIMVTAFGTREIVNEAMRLGAADFIRKPFTLDYLERDVVEKVNVQLFEDLRNEIEEKDGLIDQLKK